MKEPEQHFSPESIDQLTERFFGQLPARDSRLIAELYQTYTPVAEEYSRSLQRIWSRFAQEQGQLMPFEDGQRGSEARTSLGKEQGLSTNTQTLPFPALFSSHLSRFHEDHAARAGRDSAAVWLSPLSCSSS